MQGAQGPAFATEGFSGRADGITTAASQQIANFSVAAPYYSNVNFNATTGTYTVPATGRYSIKATINYTTTAAISVTLGGGINPSFVVRRIADSTTLVSGLFPVLNVNVALVLTLRTILGNGTVTLAGDVQLNANDTIGLFYVSDGLTVNLNLGAGQGIVWSVYRIA
ncbi:hypothetical protein [Rossellomorea marisflavi]|uniref:hypothetical protein n=1 Tax=Rossellomorea marisflavi TaxID=189381 RepID=UPI000A446AE1|nr:hypothetical protein [Rossellomorea marisflavi]